MRTIKLEVYKFEELNSKAQAKAIDKNSDMTTLGAWFDSMYSDAETVGLKLTGFEISEVISADGHFVDDAYLAALLVMEHHGPDTDTYKLAEVFAKSWSDAVALHSDGFVKNRVEHGKEQAFDDYTSDSVEMFLRDFLEAYAKLLYAQYEYLTSEEQIKEYLITNEYEFLADGEVFTNKLCKLSL